MATLWHPFITTVAITSLPMRPSAYYIPPTDPPTKPLSPCNGTFHSLCQRQHRPREQPQQLHLMFLQRQACASEITPCYACTLQSCSCASHDCPLPPRHCPHTIDNTPRHSDSYTRLNATCPCPFLSLSLILSVLLLPSSSALFYPIQAMVSFSLSLFLSLSL